MNCLNCYCHVNRTKRTEVATIWSLAGNHLWAVDRNTSAWTYLMLNKQAGLPVCISRHCLGRKRTDEFNDDLRVGRNILIWSSTSTRATHVFSRDTRILTFWSPCKYHGSRPFLSTFPAWLWYIWTLTVLQFIDKIVYIDSYIHDTFNYSL